jgi:outer membrane protein assembly factor BamB
MLRRRRIATGSLISATVDVRKPTTTKGRRLPIVLLGMPLALIALALGGCGGRQPTPGMQVSAPQVGAGDIDVFPRRAAITTRQTLKVTAFTKDPEGVSWSVSPAGAAVEPTMSHSGQAVTFTAGRAGVYTIRAATPADPPGPAAPTQTRSLRVGVTDLPGVYTYHDDLARDGLNDREYALTPADLTASTFGKLFSCPVDGAIYAQPLWVSHLQVDGEWRNVVFVATAHDSLYAFDADESPCAALWKVSLIDRHHGSDGGEASVPAGSDRFLVGRGDGDVTPEVGVLGTPVIDPTTGTLYVVSKSVIYSAGLHFHVRLHAIDLATGAEKPGAPVTITATAVAEGGKTVRFDPRNENQRAGLALVNGTVYVAFGSHEDHRPFYGWLLGYRYDGSSFERTYTLNVAPNSGDGGIWMAGAAPAADAAGNLYLITGNARFDAAAADPPNDDYGDSLLKLSGDLRVLQYFTPSDQQFDDVQNNDFGSGGVVLANLPGASRARIALAAGKDGDLFVIDREHLGGYGDEKAWQEVRAGTEKNVSGAYPGVIFTAGAFWNDRYYAAGAGEPLKAYRLDPVTARLTFQGAASEPRGFGYPGGTPAISAAGDANGVVWVLDIRRYCTPGSQGCGPAVLRAYDALTLRELWSSPLSGPDAAGNAVKFTVPTIANGRVYVGTRGNNTGGVYGSTPISGELDVYGLEPR